jgi:choline-sulfatase
MEDETVNKPNVLLIMTDEQRWDTLGCYGNEVVETANLDWLASEGTVFTNAYTCTPSCIPARASLMTGMDPWNVGILGMGKGQGPLSNLENSIPGELSKSGYHTQGVGKMHFTPQRSLQGFHNTVIEEVTRVEPPGHYNDYGRWFEANKTGDYGPYDHAIDNNSWMARPYHAPEFLHPNNWTINESICFLLERDPTKPFFLKTSFTRPHAPFDAPPYYFDYYEKQELPQASVGEWASIHDVPGAAAEPNAWHGHVSDRNIHKARAGYYGQIHHIDHQIGRLFNFMRNQRLLDNTIIIFTSDHGNMMGDHHLWRKTYAYEGSAHIPLIVRLPKPLRVNVQSKVHLPVCLQDIMPTILEVADAEIPKSVDGRSLLPLIRGEAVPWREFVHGEHCGTYDDSTEMQYLTDGTWKYIWYTRADREQLFNLSDDRHELHDLTQVPHYAKELVRWRQRLIQVLEPRQAGLIDGDRLVSQRGRPYLLSPNDAKRRGR